MLFNNNNTRRYIIKEWIYRVKTTCSDWLSYITTFIKGETAMLLGICDENKIITQDVNKTQTSNYATQ